MPGRARGGLAVLALLWALATCLGVAAAGDDPLAAALRLVELGTTYVEIGTSTGDPKKVAAGVTRYREARALYQAALAKGGATPALRNRIQAHLADVESRIAWHTDSSTEEPEVRIPPTKSGEAPGPWCRRVRKLYDETKDPLQQAALARGLASYAGPTALPTLLRLFEQEEDPKARAGIHAGLAQIGGKRVASKMASFARRNAEAHWEHALAVIYLCLEQPGPEKPFLRSIRAFHKLKDRSLTLQVLGTLDAMDPAGTAALGEVIYVPDFGHHEHAIKLLAAKRDVRAVPPLLYKMKGLTFRPHVQTPAHKALLALGWYAVPGLLEKLNDKAASSWIPWTLRKITGETMGADKRAWHAWWKSERTHHPELFAAARDRSDARNPTGGKSGNGK